MGLVASGSRSTNFMSRCMGCHRLHGYSAALRQSMPRGRRKHGPSHTSKTLTAADDGATPLAWYRRASHVRNPSPCRGKSADASSKNSSKRSRGTYHLAVPLSPPGLNMLRGLPPEEGPRPRPRCSPSPSPAPFHLLWQAMPGPG